MSARLTPEREQEIRERLGSTLPVRKSDAEALLAEVQRWRERTEEAETAEAQLRGQVRGLKADITELEAQRERRRGRLVALQNDALDTRGSLSPNCETRKVPFPLGETLTPAVDWLINRVAELEAVVSGIDAPAELAGRPSRAEVLRQEADEIVAHCPDHTDGEEAWMDCHCDVADEMRRRASKAEAGTPAP
jgi:uncharacterized membrane protein YccC